MKNMKRFCLWLLFPLIFFCIPVHSEDPPGKAPTPIQAPQIQPKGPDLSETVPPIPTFQHAFWKMIMALIALLLLIFFSVWVLKRLAQGRLRSMASKSSIKIIERKSISPKSILYLIEVDGKEVLISESQLEVRCLTTLGEPFFENETDKS